MINSLVEGQSPQAKMFNSESSIFNRLEARSDADSDMGVHIIKIDDDDESETSNKSANFEIKLEDVVIKFDDSVPAEHHDQIKAQISAMMLKEYQMNEKSKVAKMNGLTDLRKIEEETHSEMNKSTMMKIDDVDESFELTRLSADNNPDL